jgi:hypothetical protein
MLMYVSKGERAVVAVGDMYVGFDTAISSGFLCIFSAL